MDGERPSTSRGRGHRPQRAGPRGHHPSIAEEDHDDPTPSGANTPRPPTPPHPFLHIPRPSTPPHPSLHAPSRVIRADDGDDDADGVFAFARPPTSDADDGVFAFARPPTSDADDNVFAFARPPTADAPAPPPPRAGLRDEDVFAFSPPTANSASSSRGSIDYRPSTARPSIRSSIRSDGSLPLPPGLQRLNSIDTDTFAFTSPATSEATHPVTPMSSTNSHRPLRPTREEDEDVSDVFAFSQPPPSSPKEQHCLSDLSRDDLPIYTRPVPQSVPSTAESRPPTTDHPLRVSRGDRQEVPEGTFAFTLPEEAHIPSDRLRIGQPQMQPSPATTPGDERGNMDITIDNVEFAYPPARSPTLAMSPTSTAYPHSTARQPFAEPNLNRSAFMSWRYEEPHQTEGLRRRNVHHETPEPVEVVEMRTLDSEDSGKLDKLDHPLEVRPVLLSGPPKTAFTERTEQTVAHGITTWGDGMGGELNATLSASQRSSIDEDSPYPEVRAAVSNIDDPEMPALTFRVLVIGIILTVMRCGVNTFFRLRQPAPFIAPTLIAFLAYPFGRFLAWALPIGEWRLPRWLGGGTVDLNPCSFNIKEHTLIVAMSDIGGNVAKAVITTATLERDFGQRRSPLFDVLFNVATQATGSAFAVVLQKSAITSASLLWPELLGTTTLLNTLHADSPDGSGMSRLRFFGIAALAIAVYTPIPSRLFTGLAHFDWPTWIAPEHITVNQVFGLVTGLGLVPLTLDYTEVISLATPFYIPWRTALNMLLGWVLFYVCLAPALYYTNTWSSAYLPLSSAGIGDRWGRVYDVSRIVAPGGTTLDEAAYHAYSPVFFTAAYHVTHMMAFAVGTSLVTHFAVHHGAHFYRCLRGKEDAEPADIHAKLMRRYAPIPTWWWGAMFVFCLVCGILAVEVYSTGLPVWGLVLALLMAGVYAIPATFLMAVTTFVPPTNVMYELVAGSLWPGRAVPLLLFKTLGIQTVYATTNFTRGLKLGHYMKIPPRDIFKVQVIGLAIACLVSAGVREWVFGLTARCTGAGAARNCAWAGADYSASVIWGLVGPKRLWSHAGPYRHQLWWLLVGAVLPPAFKLAASRWPRSALRTVNVPLALAVCYFWPNASFMAMASFCGLVFGFNYYAKRRHTAWWIKYNYVLGAALGVGCVGAQIVLFLIFDLRGISIPWWGNTVWQRTMDWAGGAVSRAPPAGGFGPTTWA